MHDQLETRLLDMMMVPLSSKAHATLKSFNTLAIAYALGVFMSCQERSMRLLSYTFLTNMPEMDEFFKYALIHSINPSLFPYTLLAAC